MFLYSYLHPHKAESHSTGPSLNYDCVKQCDQIAINIKGVETAILDSTAHLSKVLGRFEDMLVAFLKAQETKEQAPSATEEKKEEAVLGNDENKEGDSVKGEDVLGKDVVMDNVDENKDVEAENTSDV